MEGIEVVFNIANPFSTPEEYKQLISVIAFAAGSMEADAAPETLEAYKQTAKVCEKFIAAHKKLNA